MAASAGLGKRRQVVDVEEVTPGESGCPGRKPAIATA
jgi:hypothetical protein